MNDRKLDTTGKKRFWVD